MLSRWKRRNRQDGQRTSCSVNEAIPAGTEALDRTGRSHSSSFRETNSAAEIRSFSTGWLTVALALLLQGRTQFLWRMIATVMMGPSFVSKLD